MSKTTRQCTGAKQGDLYFVGSLARSSQGCTAIYPKISVMNMRIISNHSFVEVFLSHILTNFGGDVGQRDADISCLKVLFHIVIDPHILASLSEFSESIYCTTIFIVDRLSRVE
jgi:hypothetical protein